VTLAARVTLSDEEPESIGCSVAEALNALRLLETVAPIYSLPPD